MDEQQLRQHEEYSFPYHYLPQVNSDTFRTYRSWSWSLQYVTALQIVAEKLKKISPQTHVDIGCGDGALLYHLHEMIPGMRTTGVDYDQRSINLANVMSPNVKYICKDIINESLDEKFDSGTMIEVFEHIPPELADAFLQAVQKMLIPGAVLLLTVPHINEPVISKHYRHFSFESLSECVSPYFTIKEIFAFNRETFASRFARYIARNKIFIESSILNKFLIRKQVFDRSKNESGYQRIFVELVVKAPSTDLVPA